MDYKETARKCLEDAYDLHTHASPSHAPRCVTDITLLEEADRLGMAGVLLKNHYESTAGRAYICNIAAHSKKAKCFGGIALNYPLGGINASAVEAAARLGAKEIWFPTCDAENDLCFRGVKAPLGKPGIRILDDDEQLIPSVYEVFDVVKQYNLAVGTGHLSLKEIEKLCFAGVQNNVKMVFTHPEWRSVNAPLQLQQKLNDMGVLIEKAWVPVSLNDTTCEALADSIKKLGIRNVYMVTDHGADYLKKPSEAILDYTVAMLQYGFSELDLNAMQRENPQRVLGL